MLKYLLLVLISWSFVSHQEANAQVHFALEPSEGDAFGAAVAVDERGNVYVTGSLDGSVDFDPGPDSSLLKLGPGISAFVASYDRTGKHRFSFGFGEGATSGGHAIAVDSMANVYVAGVFEGSSDFDPGAGTQVLTSSGADIFLASYASDGAFRYAIQIDASKSVGYYVWLAVDGTGNACVTGGFRGVADFDPGVEEWLERSARDGDVSSSFLACYGDQGQVRSAVVLRDESAEIRSAELGEVAIDETGNVYITGGLFAGSNVDFDPGSDSTHVAGPAFFIASYDLSGGFRYVHAVEGTIEGRYIGLDQWNRIYVTGTFQGTVDLDPGAGERLLSPDSTARTAHGRFVASYDQDGRLRYSFALGYPYPYAMGVSREGDVYVSGSYISTIDLDPGPGSVRLEPLRGLGAFISSYDDAGDFRFGFGLAPPPDGAGSRSVATNGLFLDRMGQAYLMGNMNGTIDFSGGSLEGVLSVPPGAGSLYVVTYETDGRVATDTDENLAMAGAVWSLGSPYPNPSPGYAEIALTLKVPQSVRISVFDLLGREVAILREGSMPAGTHRIDWTAAEGLASGWYMIRARGNGGAINRRVLLVK